MTHRSTLTFALSLSLLAGCGSDGGGTSGGGPGGGPGTGDGGGGDGGSGAGDAGVSLAPPDLAPPPMICKTPGVPKTPWFTEITNQIGLKPTTTYKPIGTSVRAVDLDGDGFPDVISASVTPAPRDTGTTHTRFVLMNRPDPADPTGKKRILVDATATSGLLATRDGVGGRGVSIANLGDLDNDGDVDVIACPGSANATDLDPCAAFLNDGKAHFTLAKEGELEDADVFQCDTAALLDFDRDGLLDFWPGTFDIAPKVFRGSGDGTFHDVAADVGLSLDDGDPATGGSFRENFGVTACDLDGDGDQDVLLADYGRQFNQVWIYDSQAGKFTEQGMALGVASDDRRDYTPDDESYLCYCDEKAGRCPAGTAAPVAGICVDQNGNRTNDRGWYPGFSDQPFRLGGNTFSIACGDVDDDGDMDLMTAEIRHWDVGQDADPSELLINETPAGAALGKFTRPGNAVTGIDRKEPSGWNEGDMGPVFADVDLDGRKDIYLASSDYPGDHGWLWRQKDDGKFEDVTAASGAGQKQIHGLALVDLDGDGDLDLVAGTSTARGVAPTMALRVYRNDIGQDSNWLQVRLVGKGAGQANVSAIGARVRVTAGGRTQTQEVSGGYGHTAMQNDLVLTFGLGATCAIDGVEVRWPDKAATIETFKDVRANYRVQLTEGDPGVLYLR